MIISEGINQKIENAKDVVKIMLPILQKEHVIDKDKEHLWVIGLRNNAHIKFIDLVHLGTLDNNLAGPREVFRLAVMKAAKAIILVHNHPSGNIEPSNQDIEITTRLIEAGLVLGIEVLDHIIIAEDGTYFGFGDEGIITALNAPEEKKPHHFLVRIFHKIQCLFPKK